VVRAEPKSTLKVALPILVALGAGGPAFGEEGKWTFEFQPVYMQVYGHDPHVLTIHEIDLDSTPPRDTKEDVSLETENDLAYRFEFQYTGSEWGWGVDYFLLLTSQSADDLTAAADGLAGPIERVDFEVADRSFTSLDPSEVLFYEVLEDTDLEAWTFDAYATKTLSAKPGSSLRLQLGLRLGDFDNDYRAVVGIQGVGGSQLDASSNYPLLMGPLVGLAGSVDRGRNSIEAYVGQSVLLGSVELDTMSRDFIGPFGPTPTYVSQESFKREQDVAIPITEFRIRWICKVNELISLGAGVHISTWWDVPVPPGVVPIEDGDEALHENTLILFGLLGAVKFNF
jgi:hypothetical protein